MNSDKKRPREDIIRNESEEQEEQYEQSIADTEFLEYLKTIEDYSDNKISWSLPENPSSLEIVKYKICEEFVILPRKVILDLLVKEVSNKKVKHSDMEKNCKVFREWSI